MYFEVEDFEIYFEVEDCEIGFEGFEVEDFESKDSYQQINISISRLFFFKYPFSFTMD
jgi:uncharacterized protein YjbK